MTHTFYNKYILRQIHDKLFRYHSKHISYISQIIDIHRGSTLPETNIGFENRPSQKEIANCQRLCQFQGGYFSVEKSHGLQ